MADGWDDADDRIYLANGTFIDENTDAEIDNLDQILLDALAAQLVRQAFSANPNLRLIHVSVHNDALFTTTLSHYFGSNDLPTYTHSSDDPSMNTIKAIVNSGVLDE